MSLHLPPPEAPARPTSGRPPGSGWAASSRHCSRGEGGSYGPSRAESCQCLATALPKEWHEDWITGRRYLRMEPRAPEQEEQEGSEDLLVTAA